MKIFKYFILILLISWVGVTQVSAYIIYPSTFAAFDCGGGSTTATGYINWASVGQGVIENSQTSSHRNYTGYILVMITIPTVSVINFIDPSPTSSEEQDTTKVTCAITVELKGGNKVNIDSIRYRVSDSGTDNFGAWHDDDNVSTVEINLDTTTVRFQILIPNSFGDTFSETENNLVQWKCRDTGENEKDSDFFRIKVKVNDNPLITILQPDDGEYASLEPLVEAEVNDELWGIDPDSIKIDFDSYPQGQRIASITSSSNPDIYDASQDLVSCIYRQGKETLIDGERYKATITVKDLAEPTPRETSAYTVFIVKAGAIVDLIPYPCPFDPQEGTTIRYVLAKNSKVTINIYNMAGRFVKSIIEDVERRAGEHTEDKWFGDNYIRDELANGIYFCEIIAKDDEGEHRRYQSLAIFGK